MYSFKHNIVFCIPKSNQYRSHNIRESIVEFTNQCHWSHEYIKSKTVDRIMSQSNIILGLYTTMQQAYTCLFGNEVNKVVNLDS